MQQNLDFGRTPKLWTLRTVEKLLPLLAAASDPTHQANVVSRLIQESLALADADIRKFRAQKTTPRRTLEDDLAEEQRDRDAYERMMYKGAPPDKLYIPPELPNHEEHIRACIDEQREQTVKTGTNHED